MRRTRPWQRTISTLPPGSAPLPRRPPPASGTCDGVNDDSISSMEEIRVRGQSFFQSSSHFHSHRWHPSTRIYRHSGTDLATADRSRHHHRRIDHLARPQFKLLPRHTDAGFHLRDLSIWVLENLDLGKVLP